LASASRKSSNFNEGSVSKTTSPPSENSLNYRTPNSQFLSQWFDVINEMEAGASENEILQNIAEISTALHPHDQAHPAQSIILNPPFIITVSFKARELLVPSSTKKYRGCGPYHRVT